MTTAATSRQGREEDFFVKLCRLVLLQFLIPEDGLFEPSLSLALDRALMAVEGVAG